MLFRSTNGIRCLEMPGYVECYLIWIEISQNVLHNVNDLIILFAFSYWDTEHYLPAFYNAVFYW